MSGAAGQRRAVAAAPGTSAARQRSPGGTSGARVATEIHPAGPGRLARPACRRPRWSRVKRLALGLFLLSLIGYGGSVMNAPSPSQGGSSPSRSQVLTFPGVHSRASSPATAPAGSPAWSGARRQPAPRSWPLRCSTLTRRAAPSRTGWSTDCVLAFPACRRCRPAPPKASAISAGAATGARAHRAAPRTTTTSWSLRWTPGWVWRPERHGPIWSHAPAVTCELVATYQRA
jgi:hypothetical protein